MKLNQLNEGVIKVPPILIHKCKVEILKFISTTVLSTLDDSMFFKKHASIDLIPTFRYYGDAYDLHGEDDNILGVKINYDESVIPYYEGENNIGTFMLGVGIIRKNPKTMGIYVPTSNTIIINLLPLWKDLEYEMALDMYSWFGNKEKGKIAYHNLTLEEKIEFLNDFIIGSINTNVNKFMKNVNSTIEHELAHLIQYQYLKKKSVDQVSTYDSNDLDAFKYYASQVEFSPQIISAINDLAVFVDIIGDQAEPEYFDYVVKYLIGEIPNESSLISKIKENNIKGPDNPFLGSGDVIKGSRNFFRLLKDKKPKAWRKAVKYLTTEIKKMELW